MQRVLSVVMVAVVAAACAGPPEMPAPSTDEPARASARSVPPASGPAATAGGHILFQSDREGRIKLYALDPASGAVSRWTDGPDHHDVEPAWSPDGRLVALATNRFDGRTFDIAVARAGDDIRRVTTLAALERQPAWSHDGRALFFASEQDGTQAVFRVGLDGGQVTRVSPAAERALMPAVAPGGGALAYVAGGDDGLQVVVHDLVSGQGTRMTSGPEAAAWPAWSPDGTRLVWVRLDAAGASVLEVFDVAARTPVRYALEGVAALREPTWSPDGRHVLVSGATAVGGSADWDLLLMPAGGDGGYVRLTSGGGNDQAPSWTGR